MSGDAAFSPGEMQLVTFVLGQESFGIDIMHVQEIVRRPSITVVPQAPSYVEGVANLRGTILPVVDMRTKFGMPVAEHSTSSRVIVVDIKGKTVGLSVDGVSEVLRVENSRIEPAPAVVSASDAGAIAGMVRVGNDKNVVMILDAAQVCGLDGSTSGSDMVNIRAKKDETARGQDKKLEEEQLVSFFLGEEEFALEIELVREIIRYPEIVKIPNVPDYIKGVISLRDRLLPVIDLRIKFGTGNDEVTDSTRVIVIDINGIQVGLVVDRVYEVARIPRDSIFPPPQTITGDAQEQLKGIARLDEGKRIIMLLEARNILTSEELQDVSKLEATESDRYEDEVQHLDDVDEEQMVVFRLAEEQYGVRITQVQEINRLSTITRVPRAPRFVEGVVNLRGEVIPVIDLRKRFEMEEKDYTEFTRIIVSDINKRKIGIIVDEVLEVLRISKDYLEEAPDLLLGNHAARFVDGIANLKNRMIMMLNLEHVLVEKEWESLEKMGNNKPGLQKAVTTKLRKQGRSNN